ncbi:PREDICTED: uncharacterized protein LOC101296460 [Fragaria vesca subsp. vesca]
MDSKTGSDGNFMQGRNIRFLLIFPEYSRKVPLCSWTAPQVSHSALAGLDLESKAKLPTCLAPASLCLPPPVNRWHQGLSLFRRRISPPSSADQPPAPRSLSFVVISLPSSPVNRRRQGLSLSSSHLCFLRRSTAGDDLFGCASPPYPASSTISQRRGEELREISWVRILSGELK